MKRLLSLNLMVVSMMLVAAAPGLPPTPDPYPGPTSYPGPAISTPAPSPTPTPTARATGYAGLQPLCADGCDDCEGRGSVCGRAVATARVIRCGRGFGCHVQAKEPMNAPLYSPPRPKTKPMPNMPEPVMTKEELGRLERQLIPTINTIRAALGSRRLLYRRGEGGDRIRSGILGRLLIPLGRGNPLKIVCYDATTSLVSTKIRCVHTGKCVLIFLQKITMPLL